MDKTNQFFSSKADLAIITHTRTFIILFNGNPLSDSNLIFITCFSYSNGSILPFTVLIYILISYQIFL